MPAFDLGADVATNWVTTVSPPAVLTVTLPDTSQATPAVSPTNAGYAAVVPATQPGRYFLRWSAAGTAWTDQFDVWPDDPRMLISVADARKALGNLPASRDDDVRLYVAAATPVIEDLVGAVLTAAIVQRADGGKTGIALWERPDRVDQVTVNGEYLADGVGYTLDQAAAILYAGPPDRPGRFPPGRQNITVRYTAGMSDVPPNVRLATRELVRHNWQVSMQGSRPAFGDDPAGEDLARTPTGFAVPRRVVQLCAPNPRLPGIG